ncbi:alpha/beta fold hydrolase [Microlunatus antarcticus]|uniref:Pimeloyl-ACP methyl ester carboxylesterase n=1 Tax=Microlunatus antarcticus TaxID=53388 RepID=A0A7W5JSS0_9ACTN|nr:alpha/beta hydrolase [Microlunatus antarcticus]MBB3325588.1 pimeloyl-ACP methyl ester carboxylesterase [Microlunatus antarcticus]
MPPHLPARLPARLTPRRPVRLPVRRLRTPSGPTRGLPAWTTHLGTGVGLVAGVLALAAGGVAVGLELEQRMIGKRVGRAAGGGDKIVLPRSLGPTVRTPDGVPLHTEIDERADDPRPAYGTEDPPLPDGAPTLVLVHGYALNLDCWLYQREHFRGRVRQVLYDQRSHGRSGHSSAEYCRVPQLAEDLRQVLAEVTGDGPVILAGHSMGGMTIMHLALSHPDLFGPQVKGVALFSTSAGSLADFSPLRVVPGHVFSRVAPPMLTALNRVPELVRRTRQAGSDLGFVATRRMAFGSDVPGPLVELVSEMLGETSLEVVADFYPTFSELDAYEAFDVIGRVPCAVVSGIDDVFTPIEHTDRIIELLPEAAAVRVEHCGHLGLMEHPAVFSRAIDDLYARVLGTADVPGAGEGPGAPGRDDGRVEP